MNIATPSAIAYSISSGVVEITDPTQQGDNLIALMFVISPGKAIYVQMGPLAAAPVVVQN